MQNFVYAIGSRATRTAVLVDPAWDVRGLLDVLEADGMRCVGALGTHYHPDHIGGEMMGLSIEGISTFISLVPAKVRVHEAETAWVRQVTGVEASDLEPVSSGDKLDLGGVVIEFLHTPGHTPGSQCFLVQGERLVAGDTLFVRGCGRVDLPGSDPEEMYRTLTQRLARLGDETVLYPGHDYGPTRTSTLGEERRENVSMRVPDLESWLRFMG